jgi:hypothetical protein
VKLRKLAPTCAVVFLAAAATMAGPLEGRWLLVEETYGTGGLDLTRDRPPQTIEFVREGGRLAARTRIGPGSRPARPWPSFVIGESSARIAVHEILIAPAEDGVRARYTVSAFRDGDDMVLEVVEDYHLEGDGQILAGTVLVKFLRGDESRGTFELHRRFERQP